MNRDIRSVGVVDLVCSTVTSTIAPVAGHPGIDYISIAGSTSPKHRNLSEYPRLFHTVSSSNIFSEAMLKLMENFEWKEINIIHDSLGVYYITTVQDFVSSLNSNEKEYNILTQTPINIDPSDIHTALDNIQTAGGRIVYSTVTVSQAPKIMCEAQKRGLVWPAYAHIFSFITPDEVFKEVTADPNIPCSLDEIIRAAEGFISLQLRLERDNDTILESGQSYQEYKELYLQRLAHFSADRDMNLISNDYANILYDQVWAFALALNSSLDMLDSMNLTLNNYGFGEVIVSDIIQEHLANISFQGASGHIEFNTDRESRTSVNILQVQNGSIIHVATYYPHEGKLRLLKDFLPKVPKDTFGTIYNPVGSAYAITILVICGIGYVFTTTILVFLLYWRKQSEIKASSPYLSLTMFAACYLLITTAFVRIVNHFIITVIENVTISNISCNIEIWFRVLGLHMVFATLFVKTLRVFYVFNSFRKTSKYWKDQYMFVGVLAVLSPQLVLLVLWTATDRVHQSMTRRFLPFEDPPRYETQIMCDSDNMTKWLVVSSAYNAVIIGLVVLLAVQTRHIKQRNFKDTKKMNIFVATTIIFLVIFLLLGYIFQTIDQLYSLSHFFLCIDMFSGSVQHMTALEIISW